MLVGGVQKPLLLRTQIALIEARIVTPLVLLTPLVLGSSRIRVVRVPLWRFDLTVPLPDVPVCGEAIEVPPAMGVDLHEVVAPVLLGLIGEAGLRALLDHQLWLFVSWCRHLFWPARSESMGSTAYFGSCSYHLQTAHRTQGSGYLMVTRGR